MPMNSHDQAEQIWKQRTIPGVWRKRGGGEGLALRLSYREGNKNWLRGDHNIRPRWHPDHKAWSVPGRMDQRPDRTFPEPIWRNLYPPALPCPENLCSGLPACSGLCVHLLLYGPKPWARWGPQLGICIQRLRLPPGRSGVCVSTHSPSIKHY